jgi:hypothetical protein
MPSAQVAAENAKSVKVLDELMQKLTISKEADAIKESAAALASFINGRIEDLETPTKTVEALKRMPPFARRRSWPSRPSLNTPRSLPVLSPTSSPSSPASSLALATRSPPSRMPPLLPLWPLLRP